MFTLKIRSGRMKKIMFAVAIFIMACSGYSKKPVTKISFKSDAQKRLEHKLNSIKLDKIEFDDEDVLAVFKYIRLITKQADPSGKGINFVFKDLDKSKKRITILLEDVPVMYAVKSVCEVANLTYRIDDYSVFIQPKKESK